MLDHRMRRVTAECADDAQQEGARLRALRLEFDLALTDVGLDALEPFEEIVIPRRAPNSPSVTASRPTASCLRITSLDLAVFDFARSASAGDLAARALLARVP